jgi:hypothetical protein
LFIRNCLTEMKHLTVIAPSDTLASVLEKMAGHLSLPVVTAEGEFQGLISKRTIFEAYLAKHQSGVSYDDFLTMDASLAMNTSVTPLSLDNHFEDTIEIITQIPFVPIVDNHKFVGIVKRSDVQGALAIAFATHVESDRILLGAAEVEGALERLFNITHKLGLNVVTCVPFDASHTPLNRRIILKVEKSEKLDNLIHQLEKSGFLVIEVN